MSTADRKAELERKKLKLAAMREEKKRKEEERRQKKTQESGDAAPEANQSGDLRSETEQMLKDLGIPTEAKAPAGLKLAKPTVPDGDPGKGEVSMTAVQKPRKVNLGVFKVTQTDLPPKELVSYSKETQTPAEQVERDDDDTDSLDVAVDTPPHATKKHLDMSAILDESTPAAPKEEKPELARELSEDEKKMIMNTEDFAHFFDRASRIVERGLTEKVDIFVDYTGEENGGEDGGLHEGDKLKLSRQFFDERWSKHRTVTCIDWSTQHPELMVASYNNNDEAPHEPDGIALIWNTKFKKSTPEYIFHCQSAVMSTCFAKFHPNLVVGGTYSGQIVLWDNRTTKRTPAQRTPLSSAAHTHPVYCVDVVGTQNAHNLISVSTDGKMCSWSLDMLSQPQDSMELQYKQSKAVAVTCNSFLSSDVNNFVVGCEEGAIYSACRHGSKAGISDIFEGHSGPVTGIDCHNVPGPVNFSQYFISSSFDWTVKLWNNKESKALYSFEDNSDYVYDAKWSPIHPALFATVDGTGKMDLWNLNKDTEVPIASTIAEGNVALNRCRWHSNGHTIAVGDDVGKIHIYEVGETVAQPKNDEWSQFVHTLADLKSQQSEKDDDAMSLSSIGSPPLR